MKKTPINAPIIQEAIIAHEVGMISPKIVFKTAVRHTKIIRRGLPLIPGTKREIKRAYRAIPSASDTVLGSKTLTNAPITVPITHEP